MNKKIFSLFAVIAFLYSCNNQKTPSESVEDNSLAEPTSTALSGEHCYSYIKDKDSITLNIIIADSSVVGKLRYNLYEKDTNDGAINGSLKNDTLLADYKFMSEGKQSVRQIAFLLTDSTAKEGYGEMQEQDSKMIFANPHALSFNNAFTLLKKQCD